MMNMWDSIRYSSKPAKSQQRNFPASLLWNMIIGDFGTR